MVWVLILTNLFYVGLYNKNGVVPFTMSCIQHNYVCTVMDVSLLMRVLSMRLTFLLVVVLFDFTYLPVLSGKVLTSP